jgi:hypothetical protein
MRTIKGKKYLSVYDVKRNLGYKTYLGARKFVFRYYDFLQPITIGKNQAKRYFIPADNFDKLVKKLWKEVRLK